MANKRTLKRNINAMIVDVIDECIYIQDTQPSKEDASESLINEVIQTYNDLLSKINKAKGKGEFAAIVQSFEEKSDQFIDKLNALNQN
ncbi:MAG: hypothetical protein ACO28O_01815 [Crocinitomicaceae bacterium]|jgi:hypothetical protein